MGAPSASRPRTGSATRLTSPRWPRATSRPRTRSTRSSPRAAPTSASWHYSREAAVGGEGGEAASLKAADLSGADVVELAGVEVEAVGDLPERGHGLERVAAFEWGQVVALQDLDQVLIALHQDPFGFGQLHAHRVLHPCTLR